MLNSRSPMSLSHKFHDIVAVSGTMRHQLMELLGPEDRPIHTARTVSLCFMGDEVSDTQRDNLAGAGFPDLAGMIASGTMALIGNKGDQWLFRKQSAKRQVALQLLQMAIQTSDEGKSTVFFQAHDARVVDRSRPRQYGVQWA